MKNIAKILILFILTCSPTLVAFSAEKGGAVLVFDGEVLVLESTADSFLDLGKTHKDETLNYRIEIRNASDHSLIIFNVRGSCGISIPRWPRQSLEPGANAFIQVRIDTRRIGNLHRNITIHSNDKYGRTIIPLSLEILPSK